jgi:signal transduction histidine kinase/DNA-binding response OmpR family regulator
MPRRIALLIFLVSLPIIEIHSQELSIEELKERLERHTKDDSVKVNLLNQLSLQYQWIDFYNSLNYSEQALKIAQQLSFRKGIATALYRSAHCHWAFSDSKLAIEDGLKALNLAEEDQMLEIVAESSQILARCYMDQKESEKAEFYINKAEKISYKIKNWDLLSRVYNLAGVIQFLQSKDDTALLLYNKALEITELYPTSKTQISQIVSNIAEGISPTDPQKGFEYFNKALQSAMENRNRSAEAGILSSMGAAYLKQKQFAKAEKCLLTSLQLAEELGLKRVIRHVYDGLAKLKMKQGNTEDAFRYLNKYHEVNNSILNIAKTREIVELEAMNEAAKNEQRITLLEQEKRIETIWKNVLIIGAILMTIALGVIYRLQKLRAMKAKQLLKAQKELTNKLQETDILKSRFYANISHEFRTPLSLILAPVEDKLAKPGLKVSEIKYFAAIQRNAQRLLELVNQLMDLSKLEAGKMNLNIRQKDLNSFINLIAASFDSLAKNRNIHFKKNIGVINEDAWYDADKLEKIINNVLFNAFKFTPSGGAVELSVTETNSQELTIRVSDTGKGIPNQDLDHIFSAFYQSKNLADDGQPGTGLGLALVSELVKLHHGKIELKSKVDAGTIVSIILPIHKMEWAIPQKDPTLSSSSLPNKLNQNISNNDSQFEPDLSEQDSLDSILIIEDNQELRSYIASRFTNQFIVHMAIDGEDGLTQAIDHMPDLIISDVMMPKMDGLELADKLKSDERTSHIPVILLTAKADLESRIEGFKKGADEYIAKPFSAEELKVRAISLIEQRKRLAQHFKDKLAQPTQAPVEPTIDEKFISKARDVIENNINNQGFSVELLAEEMNLSRAQLFRKFKALINTSPSEFINDIRLSRAAKMIRSKTDTLAQICYAVGFNEQSYFSKRFRKKYGMSPSEYADSSS